MRAPGRQAAKLEETAAAIATFSTTVKRLANVAAHANRIASNTKAEAEKSNDVVRGALEAMGRIEKSSRNISQIIGAIDDIAFRPIF